MAFGNRTINEIRNKYKVEELQDMQDEWMAGLDADFKSETGWIYPFIMECRGCGNISKNKVCKYCGTHK